SMPLQTGFDPGKLTVLEHNSDEERGPELKASRPGDRAARAKIIIDEPESIRIDADTPKDNFLILADTFYPGWVARVDRHIVPIVEADSLMRAVLVPAGRHVVEFNYE